MKYVIIDFNGTIVDDVELSLAAINHAAKKFLQRDEISLKEYKHVFTFPIIDYYRAVGFDFDVVDWDEAAHCWFNYYTEHQNEAPLADGILDFLKSNREKGYKNVVLSASISSLLEEQLKQLGVYDLFDEIIGKDNIYAPSKVDVGLKFIKDKDPKDCIMIGDTCHDKEVADQMGVDCILVSSGHEAKERLQKVCGKVVDSIKEVSL